MMTNSCHKTQFSANICNPKLLYLYEYMPCSFPPNMRIVKASMGYDTAIMSVCPSHCLPLITYEPGERFL
jgi:hypothetical protein